MSNRVNEYLNSLNLSSDKLETYKNLSGLLRLISLCPNIRIKGVENVDGSLLAFVSSADNKGHVINLESKCSLLTTINDRAWLFGQLSNRSAQVAFDSYRDALRYTSHFIDGADGLSGAKVLLLAGAKNYVFTPSEYVNIKVQQQNIKISPERLNATVQIVETAMGVKDGKVEHGYQDIADAVSSSMQYEAAKHLNANNKLELAYIVDEVKDVKATISDSVSGLADEQIPCQLAHEDPVANNVLKLTAQDMMDEYNAEVYNTPTEVKLDNEGFVGGDAE